jgi:hypothetical protein
MAENLGGRFATMSEEERRRFALEQEQAGETADESTRELEFDEPRRDPGRTRANLEDRDGSGALVDEEEHQRRVREEAEERGLEPPDSA